MNYRVLGLIGRISELAAYINLNCEHDVFLNDFGHIRQIDMRLYIGGWDKEKQVEIEKSAYYDVDHYYSEEGREAALKEIIETLEYFRQH